MNESSSAPLAAEDKSAPTATIPTLENGAPLTSFQTPMSDGLTIESTLAGSWSRLWQAMQEPDLPPHRIDHTANTPRCTCGYDAQTIEEWSVHAADGYPRPHPRDDLPA